ncbi:hypothetical protein L596_006998 [Steinernema carpocapsae]|uniref:Ubiquitin-like domain-containing protein n=1 Tax=Steinernema carpocapsae TaxID=34508 RepID=A0A4U5P7S5_STECR|nr:hypothetical protein L596_006998 [Steinernema carpocapsae]
MATEAEAEIPMSPASGAAETMELTIRCGMQSYDDVILSCPTDWSVKQLKEHLKDVYPSQPEVERQRLIFYGRCLEDHRIVTSYFPTREPAAGDASESRQSQVIHLVCPPRNTEELNEGLRRRGANNATNENSANPQLTQQNPNVNPGHPGQQYHWMPQMYGYPQTTYGPTGVTANNYAQAYAAYMQYYSNALNSGFVPGYDPRYIPHFYSGYPIAVNPTVTFQNGNGQHGVARAFVVQHQVIQHQHGHPGAAQAQAEAVGVAANDEPHQPRDFAYKAFQIGLLLMIVLTNSSMERFFAVFATILFVWFLQTRRAQQEQPAAPQHQPEMGRPTQKARTR